MFYSIVYMDQSNAVHLVADVGDFDEKDDIDDGY